MTTQEAQKTAQKEIYEECTAQIIKSLILANMDARAQMKNIINLKISIVIYVYKCYYVNKVNNVYIKINRGQKQKRGKCKKSIIQNVNVAALYAVDHAERVCYFDYTHPETLERAVEYTENLLLDYKALLQYLKIEKQYIIDVLNGDEKRADYLINNPIIITEDPFFRDHIYRYIRTKTITDRIESALQRIRLKKGYYIIEARYFETEYYGGSVPTWKAIADDLAGQFGFSEKLNEKTVRTTNAKTLEELANYIFEK